MQIRQGDLLFEKINYDPSGDNFKKAKNNIIEYGEATGHAHVLATPENAELLTSVDKEIVEFINAIKPAVIGHDTHKSVSLEPGNWRVIRQRSLSLREHGVTTRVID